MGNIKKLDGYLVSKIAAGEVLGGVHSVVKELVENSIDSGALKIEVFLENGGLGKILVKDDGDGILPEDMELAVTRYATSKIDSFDCLFELESYGFRGEALASICSVSRFELTSSVQGLSGFTLTAEGGKITETFPSVFRKGTSVKVQDIFFNVPARRKFLKTASGEALRAKKAFACLCLSNPGVSFLWNDEGKKPLSVSPEDDIIERYCAFFSGDLRDHFVPFEHALPDLRVHGILGEPSIASKKPFSPLFVNKRAVTDKSLSAAVRIGYGPLVFDRLPLFAVFVEIDPSLVDVNVHPSKENVKFSDPGFVFREIKRAVSNAISPARIYKSSKTAFNDSYDSPASEKTQETAIINTGESEIFEILKEPETVFYNPEKIAISGAAFFQIHDTYIIAETKGGIMLIDQHAAAERILYEEILFNKDLTVQNLLFPVIVNLNDELWDKFEKTKGDMLYSAGFRVKLLSHAVSVEGVPSGIENNSPREISSLVKDILSQNGKNDTAEKTARAIACKASIRAGDRLQPSEIESLIGKLFLCRCPHVCPHGRPTIVRITTRELEKRFGRTK
ncbi:DNA mismatch repair endonuclease MutL [candidate division WOR-3 bacterium]|nr:DNA mismatch repair endonuclease MutL [candidate division WOR-3 bacterium]